MENYLTVIEMKLPDIRCHRFYNVIKGKELLNQGWGKYVKGNLNGRESK